MALTKLLVCVFSLALLSYGLPEALETRDSPDFASACDKIAAAISGASEVFFPPAPEYLLDISLYNPASVQPSVCSVEPGTAKDLSKILQILGSCRTPFAVKGGGHNVNPGYSSTKGVLISMARFNETKISSDKKTVALGAGLTWDQVYDALQGTGLNVVGGRVLGVGVAGLILGGGFSYKSSELGLVIDNVVGYELVLPNGTVVSVTSKDKDLWFGLRGGFNNFGIVTKFILKLYPQTDIWGGFRLYGEDQLDTIRDAFFRFQQKDDPKVSGAASFTYAAGQLVIAVGYFYDAPTPGEVYDELLAIPFLEPDGVGTTNYSAFVKAVAPVVETNGRRVLFDAEPVEIYSPAVFDAFLNQTLYWGPKLFALDKNMTLLLAMEPFLPSVYSHGSDSAWPPDRSIGFSPSVLDIQWTDPSLDDFTTSALIEMQAAIHDVAVAEGQKVANASKYVNYALFDTPLENLYGKNLKRLRKIRKAIDPQDVMGLAGGWKF